MKPLLLLSIRQPWAWLILHAGKDVENRCWKRRITGTIGIHAAAGMTRQEYAEAWDFARAIHPSIQLPEFAALPRGGIVGTVEILGCVDRHPSPWFTGPFGFLLADPQPITFRPCKGNLGFFPEPPPETPPPPPPPPPEQQQTLNLP